MFVFLLNNVYNLGNNICVVNYNESKENFKNKKKKRFCPVYPFRNVSLVAALIA